MNLHYWIFTSFLLPSDSSKERISIFSSTYHSNVLTACTLPLWMIWPVVWSYPRIPVNFSQLYIGYGWSYVLECNIKFITPTPPNAGKLSSSQLKKYPKGKIMCWDIIHQDHKQKLKVNTCTKRSSELYNFAGSCILAQSMQTQGITRLGR